MGVSINKPRSIESDAKESGTNEKLARIERRYNQHNEKLKSADDQVQKAYEQGWFAAAEYVLLVLGYDIEVSDEGTLEIKA